MALKRGRDPNGTAAARFSAGKPGRGRKPERADTTTICIGGCKEGEKRSALLPVSPIIKTARRIKRPFPRPRNLSSRGPRELMLRINLQGLGRIGPRNEPERATFISRLREFPLGPRVYLYSRPFQQPRRLSSIPSLISRYRSIFMDATLTRRDPMPADFFAPIRLLLEERNIQRSSGLSGSRRNETHRNARLTAAFSAYPAGEFFGSLTDRVPDRITDHRSRL